MCVCERERKREREIILEELMCMKRGMDGRICMRCKSVSKMDVSDTYSTSRVRTAAPMKKNGVWQDRTLDCQIKRK